MKTKALFYFFIMCFLWGALAQAPNLKVVHSYGEEQNTTPAPLPEGLLATPATTRLKTLQSLEAGAVQENWVEKIIEMALLDPAVSVRMEAEQSLSRIQPLSEQEKVLLFQLSSPHLHERSSALKALKNHHPLKWPLQYAILKDIAFSPNKEGQAGFKGIPFIESETNTNHLSNYFVEHHPLMQKILLRNLNYPYTQDRAQVILSSITLASVIQWELFRVATGFPSNYTNKREKAFWILVKAQDLRLEVELGLVQVAVYDSGKQHERVTLREALVMDKSEVDSALLAYHILLKRSFLSSKAESELAYLAVSEKSDVSKMAQERAQNILQEQMVLHASTEKILINRLLFSLEWGSSSLKTVQNILDGKHLNEVSQNQLLQVMSSQKSSSKAKKVARALLLHNKHTREDIIKKAGFLFRCQRVFAL